MELVTILCITLIPLAISIIAIITFWKMRQLRIAKLEKRQALYISTIQNCYLPNADLYEPTPRRTSNLSTFDISTINVQEQMAAFSYYETNQPIPGVRETVPEYTKPPAYNPNYH